MAIIDVLTAIATAGTTIQSFFAWSGYNRDNFGQGVGWRQAHQYQKKNYYANWVASAREDLLQLKGASMHHIGNYMMVATMMLSSTVLAFAVSGFDAACPAFVVYTFYTSAASAVVCLMLAVTFGIKAQGSAYESTALLLTEKLRPFNPDEAYNYLEQAQRIERLGVGSLLRVPGQAEDYNAKPKSPDDSESDSKPEFSAVAVAENLSELCTSNEHLGDGGGCEPADVLKPDPELQTCDSEESSGLENLTSRRDVEYLKNFHEFILLWKPHEDFCKICMGLGTISFAEASAAFTVGKVLGHTSYFMEQLLAATVACAFLFIMINVFLAYGHGTSKLCPLLLATSDICATIAGSLNDPRANAALVPGSFLLRLGFWVAIAVAICKHSQYSEASAHAAKTPVDKNVEKEFTSTEDMEAYKQRSQRKYVRGRRAVLQGLCVCVCMWISVTVWATVHYTVQLFLAESHRASVAFLEVEFPSRFTPHGLACADGHMFVADRYSIYEVWPAASGRSAVKRECKLDGPIEAISATCDLSGCHPVALVNAQSGSIVTNCSAASLLLGDGRVAQHLATPLHASRGQGLLTTHGNELVEYGQKNDGWAAERTLSYKYPQSQRVRGLAWKGNSPLVLRIDPDGHLDLEEMKLGERSSILWHLPTSVSQARSVCSPDAASALLLVLIGDQPHLAAARPS
ncbi:unnamed protein product [Symbiodinium sp. CCMP2592]|nr:unnamed protein product [Symbiodinium sp. CCMP2592]